MRKEYNLKQMKVKRRGVLPLLNRPETRPDQVSLTLTLDQDIVAYFNSAAEQPGALPYQAQINQVLRQVMETDGLDVLEIIKNQLLNDPEFIRKLAQLIKVA
ncbi:MAG: BrnA antitoxin family protein [Thioploca sp.]|nr:BrnA antitoxin family protein [Thioploca sp.]